MNSTILERRGKFKLVRADRYLASPPTGMKSEWTEFQIWEGRRIIKRSDFKEEAVAYLNALTTH